jgi:FHS family L-fucose permease-like MFS transporter
MIGRCLGAPVLRRIGAGNVLAVCATAAAVLVTTSMITGGHAAMWTILAAWFFNSIMFPTIFSLGIAGLGPLTGNGSGLLNHFGLHHAFALPVICYLYIFFYALSGSRPNSERYSV